MNDVLYGTSYKRELLRQALDEMDWRPKESLNILEGRRYSYKGFRNRIAMDGSFASYEYIQDALLRLQIGFDKGKIDMGIVLVTAQRSEKSPLGSTRELVEKEIEMLYPTINLPVTIALFDLGRRGLYAEEGAIRGSDEINTETIIPQIQDHDLENKEDNHEGESIHPEYVKHYLLTGNKTEKQTGRKKKTNLKSEAIVTPKQAVTSSIAAHQ